MSFRTFLIFWQSEQDKLWIIMVSGSDKAKNVQWSMQHSSGPKWLLYSPTAGPQLELTQYLDPTLLLLCFWQECQQVTQGFETPLHLQWRYYQGPAETTALKLCTRPLSENKWALLGAPCSHACIPPVLGVFALSDKCTILGVVIVSVEKSWYWKRFPRTKFECFCSKCNILQKGRPRNEVNELLHLFHVQSASKILFLNYRFPWPMLLSMFSSVLYLP